MSDDDNVLQLEDIDENIDEDDVDNSAVSRLKKRRPGDVAKPAQTERKKRKERTEKNEKHVEQDEEHVEDEGDDDKELPAIAENDDNAQPFGDPEEDVPPVVPVVPASNQRLPAVLAIDLKLLDHGLVYKHTHSEEIIPSSCDTRPVARFRMLMNAAPEEKKAELTKIWKRYEELCDPRGLYSSHGSLSCSTSNAWPEALDNAVPSAVFQAFVSGEAMVGEDENDENEGGKKGGGGGNLSKRGEAASDDEERFDALLAAHDHYEEDSFVVGEENDGEDDEEPAIDLEEMEIGDLETLLSEGAAERERINAKHAMRIQRLEKRLEKRLEPIDQREAMVRLVIERKKINL